jgi:hypothetical protein
VKGLFSWIGFSNVGFFSALGAFLYALTFLIKTLIWGESVKGFPTLIEFVLMLGGAVDGHWDRGRVGG